MQLHQLTTPSSRKVAKRIGRGGKRGKTSGRGMKGQTARAGNSTRPEMRDIIKKLPKLRGHGVNRARTVNEERVRPVVVNLSAIATAYKAGETVSPSTLRTHKIITAVRKRNPKVKILSNGEITIALKFENCELSKVAKEKILAAGGSIEPTV